LIELLIVEVIVFI